jgi:hypothetical protein
MNARCDVADSRPMPTDRFRLLSCLLLCIAAIGPGSTTAATGADQVPERFELTLPEGQAMVFRAVYLGIDGTHLFATRRVQLGSREPNPKYKERLVETLLSGGFVGVRKGKPDWFYYLAETEVSEAQWNAVMRWLDQQEQRPPRAAVASKLPQTGVTMAEASQFIEVLNTWTLTNQRGQIPRWRGAPAFARLPTEAEWVFAARGGLASLESNPDIFDRPHPYGEALSEHEWYRENSANRLQEVGSPAIKPNPLGLYDLLGNVEELTLNLFGPEYQQGRFGQFSICGGNYSVKASDLSAALRGEALSHDDQGHLMRPAKVGLRLALTTRISSVQATPDELNRALDIHLGDSGLTRPGPVGKASPATQADEDKEHFLQDQLARVTSDFARCTTERQTLAAEKRSASPDVSQRVAQLERRNRELQEDQIQSDARAKELQTQATRCLADLQAEHGENRRQQFDAGAASRQCADGLARCQDDLTGATDRERALRDDRDRTDALRRQLADRVAVLEPLAVHPGTGILADRNADQTLQRELDRKDQELADLRRRLTQSEHEIEKDARRVRAVEKRYIEALMRQATANAYLGWEKLSRWAQAPANHRQDPLIKKNLYENGAAMVSDYLSLVQQIATETMPELLPEVMEELSVWLAARDKDQQRKTLRLLERHVREVRSGHPIRLDDLVKSLADTPEMN